MPTDAAVDARNEQALYTFRVSLVCSCQNDVAFGRAPTEQAAREIADREFIKAHGRRATYTTVVIERAIDHDDAGGWHYAEESVALHVRVAHQLGRILSSRGGSIVFDALKLRTDKSYAFESSNVLAIRAFWHALTHTKAHGVTGQGGRSTTEAARTKIAQLRPLIKHLWPTALEAEVAR
jgi:hypothetical protein